MTKKEKEEFDAAAKILATKIGNEIETSRANAILEANQIMLETYWDVGRLVVEYEKGGITGLKEGEDLVSRLSKDLSHLGKHTFNDKNIKYIKLLYQKYPDGKAILPKLSWGHYQLLLSMEDDTRRLFFQNQCVQKGWDLAQLKEAIGK